MSNRYRGLVAVAAVCAVTGCSTPVTVESPSSTSVPTLAPDPSQETKVAKGQLFVEAQETRSQPSGTAKRSRVVGLDTSILVDDAGRPRKGPVRVVLNLFPDTVYSANISLVEGTGGSDTWEGQLDGVTLGTVTVVRVGDTFIVKVASPEGVFEVSRVGSDTYRVVEMAQGSMPTEG